MREWPWETNEIDVVRERERSAAETASKARLEAAQLRDANNQLRNANDTLRTDLARATKRASEAEDGKARLSLACDAAIKTARESAAGDALRENRELRATLEETAQKLNDRIGQANDVAAIKAAWKEFRAGEKTVRKASDKLDQLASREDT